MRLYLFILCIIVNFSMLSTNAFSAVYYVKPDGNDNLNGRSDATAWRTIGKINSFNFSTGDDVYFKCGGIWSGTHLEIDWSGTSTNTAIVGAYYLSAGTEVVGVSGNKPRINNARSPGSWDGAVHVPDGKHDITVENIRITNSAGMGFRSGDSNASNNYNILVSNVEIDTCYRQALWFRGCDRGCILEDSSVRNAPTSDDGAAIIMQYSTGTIIRRNTIFETIIPSGGSGHEGINFLRSTNSVAEYNYIYDTAGMGIYFDRSTNCTARYNIIYYTGRSAYFRSGHRPNGITLADEHNDYKLNNGQKIYGNLIANVGRGIVLWAGEHNSALRNSVIANNTIVKPFRGADARCIFIQSSSRHSNSIVQNNIFWQDSGTIAEVPSDFALDFDYNLWSRQPEPDARGNNDPQYSPPRLAKTSGWNNLTPGSLDGTEFALQDSSSAIAAGTPIREEFALTPDCDTSDWKARKIILYPQPSQSSYWDIGADIHVTDGSPQALRPPKRLSIVDVQ